MTKYTFPAIFTAGDEDEQGYTVTFPDLPGCITEGDTLDGALHMAKDVLGGFLYLMEEDKEDIPQASIPSSIKVESDEFVSLIQVDTQLVRDRRQNKAINKTITLPKWLNDVATQEGINFSHTMQEALKQKLGIHDLSK